MTEISLIGIGTGNPDHVTGEAVAAMRSAGLILVPQKGDDKSDLADLRHVILDRAGVTAPVAKFDLPVRNPSLPYLDRVHRWHDEIAAIWQGAIASAGPISGPIALLVWGDPGLYDSTLRIAARLDPAPKVRVIPGITAMQALTAAHRIPFNTVGGPVVVTTGRRLRDDGWPVGAESVIVMLDGECSFRSLDRRDLDIWWGAFLGMSEQVLVHGRLDSVADKIVELRAQARAAHGWIMDTYLLRSQGKT